MPRGRFIARDGDAMVIASERGVERVVADGDAEIGDIVEIQAGRVRVLTPARSPRAGERMRRTLDPRRLRATSVRAEVLAGIRRFFDGRGFREVVTPALVTSPGMEPHIRPFRVTTAAGAPVGYLQTSPEFAMKKLLAGGLERIYQLAPVWRDEPDAPTHRREFTMLEWYRAYAGTEDIMRDVEELVASLAPDDARFRPPWPRLRVRDLFAEHAGVDLVRDDLAAAARRLGLHPDAGDTWDDLYHRIWLDVVEPRLPADRAVFVTRYPASQAALAVVDEDPDGSRWARRFEIYAGGLELGNAFEELTDPVEQRRRFVADMELRRAIYGDDFPPSPVDEDFIAALEEGMPPSGGIAMGVDRLVMLIAGEGDIGFTSWL